MKSFRAELLKNSIIISFLPIVLLITFFSLSCYHTVKKHIRAEFQKQFSIFYELFQKELTGLSDYNVSLEFTRLKEILGTELFFFDCHGHFFSTNQQKEKIKDFLRQLDPSKINRYTVIQYSSNKKYLLIKNEKDKCFQLVAIPIPSNKKTLSVLKKLFGFWFFLGIILMLFSLMYAFYLSNYLNLGIRKLISGIDLFRKEGKEPSIGPIGIRELDKLRENIIQMAKEIINQQDEICETMSLFNGVLNSTKSLIFVVNEKDEKIILTNKEVNIRLGYQPDEICRKNLTDIFVDWKKNKNHIYQIRTKDDKTIFCIVQTTKTKFKRNDVLIITAQDISKLLKLQEEITKEKAKLDVILQSINDGVIAVNKNGKIIFLNKEAKRILKIDPKTEKQKSINELLFLKSKDEFINILEIIQEIWNQKSDIYLNHDLKILSLTKEETDVSCYLTPITDEQNKVLGVVIVIRDVTKERTLEKELMKQEKLKCLGIMASGIAHDFNNIIFHLKGNIDLIKKIIREEKELKNYFKRLETALNMASELTQQLLMFAREKPRIKKDIDIKKLIEDVIEIIALEKVNIIKEWPEDLWIIEGDETQIKQVIKNLMVNAAEAMNNEGNIYIRCSNEEKETNNLAEKYYIKIEIEDEGPGIPKEILPKIFDPFFTTKEYGTGLGLAICYSVINAHNGKIEVISEKGKGTKFIIYLPAKPISTMETNKNLNHILNRRDNTGKRILILDDDRLICETLKEMLETRGYEADYALKGEEIISKYKEALKEGKIFDLVLLDWNVKNGWGAKETLQELQKIDPQVKAVIISGQAVNLEEEKVLGFLLKPYTIEELEQFLTASS